MMMMMMTTITTSTTTVATVCLVEPQSCDTDHWQCANQQCIPLVWRCDGDIDCHDNSDEQNCTSADAERRAKLSPPGVVRPPPTLCADNQFRCVTSRECINKAWYCDGEDDCLDSSDEANCELFAPFFIE